MAVGATSAKPGTVGIGGFFAVALRAAARDKAATYPRRIPEKLKRSLYPPVTSGWMRLSTH